MPRRGCHRPRLTQGGSSLSEKSIQHDARAFCSVDARASGREDLAALVEREIERIREARPHLSSRLNRAAALLVAQLSLPAQTRPLRVRIGTHGHRPRFLVRSLTSGGVVYCVSPATFECSCPDAHRRGQGRGCKHSLAVYILLRAARTHRRGCGACERGWVFVGEEIVDPESGEVVEAINPVRCKRCREGLSEEDVQRWLESQRWHYASSRPDNAHCYCLRGEADNQESFERVVEYIREYGSPYAWWGKVYLQYVAGEHAYWTMGATLKNTDLINRKPLEQVRLDELVNKGGGGIVWPWLHNDIEAERAELRRRESAQEELGEG
jgi:hypothetical protein